MSNFSPKLEDTPDEQLKYGINEHNPHYAQLESDEMTRRTLNKLQEAIKTFNKQSSRQTKKMIKLTWGIICLTIVMVIGLIIQIILTF